MGGWRWSLGGGQWAMRGGQWAVGGREMGGGKGLRATTHHLHKGTTNNQPKPFPDLPAKFVQYYLFSKFSSLIILNCFNAF